MMTWTNKELARARRLVDEVVATLALDLRGKVVLTEAATGPFAVTASIAAVAGAQVEAVAADSPYGSFAEAAEATREVARVCGVEQKIRIASRAAADCGRADIVTNLGPLRPIDASFIARVKQGSVISLMYDAREARPGEIDLAACEERDIAVVGTNEDHPLVDVLRYSGHLVAKMLFEHHLEVLRSRIAVIGDNLFTPHIVGELHRLGAQVSAYRNWEELILEATMPLDAVVYIDYWNRSGNPDSKELLTGLGKMAGATLVQFVGGLEITPFVNAGWTMLPDRPLPPQRMWRTLADLGIRPVIELHAAGLKAAEMELCGVSPYSGGRLRGLRQNLTASQAAPVPAH
jgi:hypothetical protein